MHDSKFEKVSNLTVEDFEFPALFQGEDLEEGVHEYSIGELDGLVAQKKIEREPIIKAEKEHAKNNLFKISPVVKKYRGIKDMEEGEYQEEVATEVERRIDILKKEATEAGFKQGQSEGYQEVLEKTQNEVQEKLNTLQQMIDDVAHIKEKLLKQQGNDIYEVVRGLSKWVVLRELADDGKYIQRLLEKIVLELGTKENLLIRVNEGCFEQMPEVLEVVQDRIGKFSNARIEVLRDEEYPGIIVESLNGICDGTLKAQFESFDKLFDTVMLNEHGE